MKVANWGSFFLSEFTTCEYELSSRERYLRVGTRIHGIGAIQIRIRNIYSVIFQTQENSAKTISGRCRRGHLEK